MTVESDTKLGKLTSKLNNFKCTESADPELVQTLIPEIDDVFKGTAKATLTTDGINVKLLATYTVTLDQLEEISGLAKSKELDLKAIKILPGTTTSFILVF